MSAFPMARFGERVGRGEARGEWIPTAIVRVVLNSREQYDGWIRMAFENR